MTARLNPVTHSFLPTLFRYVTTDKHFVRRAGCISSENIPQAINLGNGYTPIPNFADWGHTDPIIINYPIRVRSFPKVDCVS